jgi:uncharacterized protein (TIRG00374 family)
VRASARQLASVDARGVVLALGLACVTILIGAWRWQVLLGAQQRSVPYRVLGDSMLVATFFNQVLPGSVGGDVMRVADSSRRAGSTTAAATTVLFDRLLGLVALFAFACVGLAFIAPARVASAVGVAGVVLVTLMSVALIRSDALGAYLERHVAGHTLTGIGRTSIAALQAFRAAPRAVAVALAGAMTTQLLLVLFYLTLARAAAVPLPLGQALAIVPAALAAQALPISISGLGVREMTFAAGFKTVGLRPEDGVTVSLLGALSMLAIGLVGGVRFVLRRSDGREAGFR